MAATLTVVNLNGQTLAQYTLQTGNAQPIAAMDNVHYQLADAQSVEAGRAGDDLVVRIQGEPALIIEDYFLLDDSGLKNPLLGLNEYGQYVAYPLVDTSALPLEHLLAEEVVASSAGAAINPAIALAAIGGVVLTGAVIAGGSKNDSKSSHNTPHDQPQTPFDPNQPAPPPADNGNITPPPSDSGNITPPPSGGGNITPPPGGSNPPPPQPGNTAPSDITLSANKLPENQAGAVIGKLATVDPDAGDSHTYTVSDQRFEVDAQGNLKLKDGVKVEFAQEKTINLQITTNDGKGGSYHEDFTLQVEDDPNYPAPTPPANQAPTDIQLSAAEVLEGKAGIVIGRLTTLDPDQSDTHTYTVDDPRFEIDAQGNLKLKAGQILNYDDAQSITVSITSSDGKGGSFRKAFTLQVQDDPAYPAPQNQAPTDLDLPTLQLPENTPGAVIGQIMVTDPDVNDSHTFAVNDPRFEIITGGILKLKAGEKIDYADAQNVSLTITVTDKAGASYQETFTINVQDDPAYPAPQPTPNQAPTDITLSAATLPENQAGAVIGKLATTDPDAGDTHTYTVNDQRFEVDAQGNLKLKDGVKVEFAQEKTITLDITTTDQGGESYQETFTINVQDDPAYPAPTPPNGGKLGVYVPKPATDFIANVKDAAYGAKGDGQTDDTAAIQKAIDAVAAQGGGIVDIPAGTYMVDGVKSLHLKNHVTVRMADDTVLKAQATGSGTYHIFRMTDVEHANILGGTLDGARDSQGQGVNGYGVMIYGSQNLVVENVAVKNVKTDGFYVGTSKLFPEQPENIVFYNVSADNSGRQGLKISAGDNIKVLNSTFHNANGIPGELGINIEPNDPANSPTGARQEVRHVEIRGNTFSNNTYGVMVSRSRDRDTVIEDIQIKDNRLIENDHGIRVIGITGGSISGNTVRDNGSTIPYFDIDVEKSSNVDVRDNTLYGGRLRTPQELEGSDNITMSGNQYKGAVYIRGEAKVGATLSTEIFDGDNNGARVGNATHKWLADGEEIAGATQSSYQITAAERGKAITVEVSYRDFRGNDETARSLPTAQVDGSTNQAPTDIALSADRLPENQAGAVIGKLTTADPDQGDSHTYSVSDNRFEIDAQGNLKLKDGVKVNFTTEPLIRLTITATDKAGASYREDFTLQVQDDPNVSYGVYQHAEYGRYVDVREFGADASGAQSSDAAVKAALAAAQQEGASLYFGEGQYRLADPIRLNDGLSNVGGIFGAGMDKTTLHYANEVYSALTVNNLDGKKIGDFTLAIDTTFYQPGVARLGPVSGIMVLDSAQTTVQRVDVSGANGAGVRFAGDRAKHEPDIRKLLNGDITADELDLGRGNQLLDSHLHHNRHSGVLIEFQEHFTARGNTFARNGHEQDGDIGYGLALGERSYNRHISITNNTTDHNYRKGLDVHDGDHIVMKGNTLKGDRLFGIAITSRTFALREVEVADNTLILDPAFHRFTDDNRSNDFNDYLGIEVQTNYERQNFPDSRPANITVADNRIENLFDPGTGSSLSHGIVVRHNSQSAQYVINIRDNHLSGQGADHAIAVFNDSGAPGALDIDNNTINIANLAHAPIRIRDSADGSGQALSGSLNVRGNTVHLGGADNSAEFLLVEKHRAQDYDIRGNTLRFDDRVDQPLIILRSGDYSGKAAVGITGNHMHTPLAELPKNWIRGDEHTNIAQQNNTHNGQPIDAGNAAPDAIRAFAEAHIPQGASYVVAGAGGGVARVILAEYEADHGQRPDYLIISDGSHHALVQQGSGGSDIGLAGWSADFAKAGYIPMTAYYQNDAAQALNQALAEAARLKLGVEMPDNGSFTLTAPVTVTNGVQYLHGNGATLAVQLADTGSNAAPRGAIEIAKGTQNADISGIKLDMAGAAGAEGILGYDAAHIHIHHNTIANLAGRPGNAAAGVTFYNGETHVHDIRVEHNRIYAQTGSESNKGQVNGVSFVGTTAPHNPAYLKDGDPIWQQYIEDGSVRPLDSDRTMKHITVQGNHIEGGYYGVNLFAVTDSLVQSNHIGNNTRNISLQNNAARNTVADNLLTDALSSAVHLAYNADHNTVRGNLIISDRLSGQALLQAYQGSEHNTFAGNRIEALHNAAARLMYTGSNDGGNRFTNNIASGRTAASAFGAEAVWDKESAGGDPSAYASNMQDPNLYAGEIRHGGGFGPMRDTVFSNNILAPEITQRPVTPIIYLAADHSQGQDGSKNIRGDLDITLNGNILLGADNAPETIRQHQNGATITLGGDGVLRDADGVYQSSQHIAYSIRDYQMGDADQHLYLLGNAAVSGTGNAADNTIIGNGRANTLSGGDGNDTLDGGYGADTLTGGKGADAFVFQSRVDGKNIDTITDFNRGEGDKIALSEIVFGQLDGDWFAQDGEAHTPDTRIYQQGNTLYHDPDGAGGSAAQAFANVGAAKLDAADLAILNHLLIV